ncbi:RagB/SusD family nutrient uptake outer membrane protein [Sphingobacterium lactis]|uniref:RagB/SusD family nutrient uptake outer membrane protein n=1 Tax=Sphingobacterium lactis TaxID=797291 RepID=UPI003F8215ED
MKTTKLLAKSAIALLLLVFNSSCKDYLNIDKYFDDEFKIDSVFSNVRYMESYMWGAAGMFPDEATTIRFNYTPGPMATDEGFNGLTGVGVTNVYFGMDFVTGNTSPDYYGSGAQTLNQWGNYYKIIRKCNLILQNLDKPRDMKNSDRMRIEGYTRFIRAYAYYNILIDYGPPILLGDEVINTNEKLSAYDRTRSTYDEAMNYTCTEFEKAAALLPFDVSILDFGLPTKGAALSLVARLRLIHASPLYNGGDAARKYFANWVRSTDNKHYVNQQYDERRWAVAAAAAKRVMDLGRYKLYTVQAGDDSFKLPQGVTSDPNFYQSFPNGAAGIDNFRSYSDVFTGEAVPAINPEIIWGKNTGYINQFISKGTFPASMGGWNRFCVTQKIVDAYLMDDGRTKEDAVADGYYSEKGFTESPKFFSGYRLNSGVYNMYANREMRFYASIGFNEAVWQAGSSMELNNQTAKYYYQDKDGRGGVTATSPNYPITGYVFKKYNHPMDAWTGAGARHIPKAYVIIRYAEILMSYAEALNNLTSSHTVELDGVSYSVSRNTDEIKNAFNQVRYRAGLPGLTADQLANSQTVQKQLERERMVEFLWENRRFYDVRRWGIYEEVEKEPIVGMNPDGATKELYYQRVFPGTSSFKGRLVDRKLIFVPIPRAELRRLPSLDQNPGWD